MVSASLLNTDKSCCGHEVLRKNRDVNAVTVLACSNAEVFLSADGSDTLELHKLKAGSKQRGYDPIKFIVPLRHHLLTFSLSIKPKRRWVLGTMRTLSPEELGDEGFRQGTKSSYHNAHRTNGQN